MKTLSLLLDNNKFATNMAFLTFIVLAVVTTSAEARHCSMGSMPYPYHGMHPHRPMPYAKKYGARLDSRHSVISVAKQAGKFGTLLTAVDAAGLTALLEGNGPFTLFAPTDDAFKKLPDDMLQELLADKNKLTALLKYHIVPNQVTALQILESRELSTASGQKLPTSDLSVVRADIAARNGIIHVIDSVLQPGS